MSELLKNIPHYRIPATIHKRVILFFLILIRLFPEEADNY